MLRELSAVVVVLNNDGGGIFHFLPVAEHEEIFEPYFGTPHGLGFGRAAEMFGLGYSRPRTMGELAGAYRRACAEGVGGYGGGLGDFASGSFRRRLLASGSTA